MAMGDVSNMKTYPRPEYLILHKIRQVRQKYPDLPELAVLEEQVLDIINISVVEDLRAAAIGAVMGRPEDLTDKTRRQLDHILTVARKCLYLEWSLDAEEEKSSDL